MKLEEILEKWDELAAIELLAYTGEFYQNTIRPQTDSFEAEPVIHEGQFMGVAIRSTRGADRWHWIFPGNLKSISFGAPADLIMETHAPKVKVVDEPIDDEEVLSSKKRPAPQERSPELKAKLKAEDEREPDVEAAMEMAELEKELASIQAQEERAMANLDGSEDEEFLAADE